MRSIRVWLAVAALSIGIPAPIHAQESMPIQLRGTWKITRMLPTKNSGCWTGAQSLVGTTLTYIPGEMRWQGGPVPLTGVVTRTQTAESFQQENQQAFGAPLTLAELRIMTPRVTEVDLQHEDADITGSTTEVPGDSVLLVARNTIIVSACGTFFEATRLPAAPRT